MVATDKQDCEGSKEFDFNRYILEIYNKRIDERRKRKQFVIERGLLDLKKQTKATRGRSTEERELYNILKPFAVLHSESELEAIMQNMLKERTLRNRVEELESYKNIGLRNFQEVDVRAL